MGSNVIKCQLQPGRLGSRSPTKNCVSESLVDDNIHEMIYAKRRGQLERAEQLVAR
jgi:hypothetical protein